MLIARPSRILGGLAVSASLLGCAHPAAPPPVSAQNAAAAKALGARLAAQARADDAEHRARLARLIRASVVRVDERDRTMRIEIAVENLASKTVRALEFAFDVSRPDGARIAIAELHANERLRPESRSRVVLVIPYTRFGDETGAIREAVGHPQRYRVDVEEITYADGSDAGYDD